jgi:hypothetical protein
MSNGKANKLKLINKNCGNTNLISGIKNFATLIMAQAVNNAVGSVAASA